MANNENKSENKVKKHFFKDFKAELKKVIWPTPKQLINSTTAVVTIVLIAALIVFVLDVVFDLMNKYGISNVQSIVNERFNSEEENNEEQNGEEQNSDENNSEENSNEENSNAENTENGENAGEQNTENPTPEGEAPAENEATNPEQ